MVEQLLRMSLNAGIVIMVVILIRALMSKLPKKFIYMLWAAVGFRLLCPVSIESRFSIFNTKPAATATSQIEKSEVYTNIVRHSSHAARLPMTEHHAAGVHEAAQNVVPEVTGAAVKASSVDVHTVMLAVWAVVAVLIAGYAVYHLIRLKIRLRGAKQVEKGIYESPLVASPFAMGLIRPGIYLPVDLPEYEREYLIEHERTHIRRGDLFYKMIAVTALAIHWFNPLVWLAFVLFCRDMEMSCDEIVLERLGADIRKNYSLSLVTLAQKSQDYSYVVMPTSFSKSSVGKTEVRIRIKNIMGFKKRSRSVAALAGIIVIAVMITCVLNACAPAKADEAETTTTSSISVETSEESASESEETVQSSEVVIDGRSDYMILKSDLSTYNDIYNGVIDDISVFEDDDIGELAASYMEQGYTLIDENGQLSCWGNLGDEEYVFNRGFFAMNNGDDCETDIWVYKMNEDLFDYYVVEYWGLDSDPQVEVEDDGTVERYNYDVADITLTAEFDRETGIGRLIYESEYTFPDELMFDIDIDEIENQDLQAIARTYSDNGYNILGIRVEAIFDDALGSMDYPYGTGYRAFWQDQANSTEYYVFFFEGDQDIFETLYSSGIYGDVSDTSVNGTVTRVTTEYLEWGSVHPYIFDYDSSSGIITIREVLPYNPDQIGGSSGPSSENEFGRTLDELRDQYGDEISSEDDGTTIRVTFLNDTDTYVIAEYNRDYSWCIITEEMIR